MHLRDTLNVFKSLELIAVDAFEIHDFSWKKFFLQKIFKFSNFENFLKKIEFWKKSLNFKSYYKKKGVKYWSLLHSQRWCVRGIWYLLTRTILLCSIISLHFNFLSSHRFENQQRITIFALLKQPHTRESFSESLLTSKVFLHFVRECSICDGLYPWHIT